MDLLERARQGDSAALENLLHEVQPQLYRFSMKMCRHTEDAEDVLQDSMMTLARSFRDFRGASSLSTWLFTIARSFCIKKRRKSKFAPPHEESFEELGVDEQAQLTTTEQNPEEHLATSQAWHHVHTAIQRIQPGYREVLVLRDVEGLAAKEVAEIVGLSVGAVKSRLHRARHDLQQQLVGQTYRPRDGCPNIHQIFSQHLEGDLSAEICSSMEAHVANCPTCATECQGLRDALNVCSSSTLKVPPGVTRRVQAALREALLKDHDSVF